MTLSGFVLNIIIVIIIIENKYKNLEMIRQNGWKLFDTSCDFAATGSRMRMSKVKWAGLRDTMKSANEQQIWRRLTKTTEVYDLGCLKQSGSKMRERQCTCWFGGAGYVQ